MNGPFADCCPRCLTVDSEPLEPYRVQDVAPPHVRAFYRCPSCGHEWRTGWNAEYVIGESKTNGDAA